MKFVRTDSTTLADLIDLHLHEFEEEVKTIVDKSVKEMAMEKTLRELDITWKAMEFDKMTHARTNTTVIGASEELIEVLENDQVGTREINRYYVFAYLFYYFRINCKT